MAAFLALAVGVTRPDAESYGDTLQIALPLAGAGCAMGTGNGYSYILRFAGMWLTMRGTKMALADAPVSRRPGGGGRGFPSGHTSAAVFGASSLVQGCLENAPLLKTAIIVGAGYTGSSRIEAGRHDITQVLAGVILALLFERGFRGGTRRVALPRGLWGRPGPNRKRAAPESGPSTERP